MRVLVTGAGGQLGSEVVGVLEQRNAAMSPAGRLDVVPAGHDELDVSSRDAVLGTLLGLAPDVVIHCAALTAVDACEREVDLAFKVNALGTRHVAEGARLVGAHVAYVSTDYVFDGTSPRPYREWDPVNPLSVYGASKLAGERELDAGATVVRTSWVCGRHGANMAKTVLDLSADASRPLRFVDDQRGSPSMTADVAPVLVDLALGRRPGVYHVTNSGETTWYGFARAVLAFAGGDPDRVEPITTDELVPPRPAPRPKNSVLDNAALRLLGVPSLPDWHDSLGALVASLRS